MANLIDKHEHSTLIDRLGGTNKAAEFFEVSAPSISEWRKKGLPKARLMYLRAVRPDVFGDAHSAPEVSSPAISGTAQ